MLYGLPRNLIIWSIIDINIMVVPRGPRLSVADKINHLFTANTLTSIIQTRYRSLPNILTTLGGSNKLWSTYKFLGLCPMPCVL